MVDSLKEERWLEDYKKRKQDKKYIDSEIWLLNCSLHYDTNMWILIIVAG